jgi:glycine/D-amino acid oxidase-like deaminating enzyme
MTDGYSRPRTRDIVTLGAGVMSASIPFHLAKRNAGKIVVIDHGHVGQGQVADLPRLCGCTTVILPRSSSPW